MREFKKNTWTLIKRLSLGLALAVPGLYQGHAQAQNIVLNFNGTITAAPCLMRVTPATGSGTTVTAASASNTSSTISLPNLNYADVYNANPGATITTSTNFKVEVVGPTGGLPNCSSSSKFQVALLATNANSVDTSVAGRAFLVNSLNPASQVGLEIGAKSGLIYQAISNLPTTLSGLIDSGTLKSNQTNLNAISPLLGNFEFSVTPVKIAAAATAFTQTSYGGSITLVASFQ